VNCNAIEPDDRAASGFIFLYRKKLLLTVLLDAGGTQASETILVERALPAQVFLGSERIALASLFK
jgi:hypothetical protein